MSKTVVANLCENWGTLKIEQGDVVVLKYPGRLPFDTKERIKKEITNTIDVKVIFLEEGMDIGVLKEKVS